MGGLAGKNVVEAKVGHVEHAKDNWPAQVGSYQLAADHISKVLDDTQAVELA